MGQNQDDQIPLSEATFCILLSLLGGPRHGYAILQDVQALSEGRVLLSTGTLYSALKRMLETGWIERADEGEQVSPSGRGQKYYHLTETGRRIFDAERARMRALLLVAGERAVEGLR